MKQFCISYSTSLLLSMLLNSCVAATKKISNLIVDNLRQKLNDNTILLNQGFLNYTDAKLPFAIAHLRAIDK